MIRISIDHGRRKIIMITSDPAVKCLLEFKGEREVYVPWFKQWRKQEVIDKLYDNRPRFNNKGEYKLEVGFGWAAYIANMFRGMISQVEYEELLRIIYSDSYRIAPFNGLRDYQNQDVLHILKYRFGLVTVNTGYGKTQVIATLANYAFNDLGKKVLIVAPGKKAKDEIIKRYESLFGFKIPTSIDGDIGCIITSGFLNQKKIKDKNLVKQEIDKLKKFEWLLVDEVEYTINPSGTWIYDKLEGLERAYAFSGTADKQTGRMITFAEGITESVVSNKDLIKYFGPSLVYRMPINIKIDNITIKTLALNKLKFSKKDESEDTNVYTEVLTKIWTFEPICKLIIKIAKKYPMLFIPINNLNKVIYEWINNYFIPEGLRTLLICSDGYIYYGENGKEKLDLVGACDYIRNGMVDIIPSTSSGYRALDFPGLENILLVQGICAGVTLQCIGRVARGKHMNIIALEPKFPKTIPVYTKGFNYRSEMIKDYYKYCEMIDVVIDENNL